MGSLKSQIFGVPGKLHNVVYFYGKKVRVT